MRDDRAERTVDRRQGFSLIEMLVVLAILGILVSLGYSALYRGRTASKETICRNNLKQIALALNLYFNDNKMYPGDSLPEALASYVGGCPDLFLCPADPDPQGDSYSRFYVSRTDHSTQHYVCGCPRHVGERSTITLFSSASAELLEMRPVLWNGQEVKPGTSVSTGVLTFADGSSVVVPVGMVVRLIQSFRMHDGRYYSLIGVDINELGTLDIEVTPGSRFEVVTPAAIAGVQGTRFRVAMSVEGQDYCMHVSVDEGEVVVKHRWSDQPGDSLTAGKAKKIKEHRARIRRKLPKRWKNRRKQLADDYLYEAASDDDAGATTGG